nr:uncharacterized protein LOC113822655 [Penaeus vannamei]
MHRWGLKIPKMNWVGGVRRRVILKEEERRRQEQFFAAHASSKIRNSGRKTKDKAEREKVNAKAMVLGKSRPNCHPWKNEQVISHCVQLGVPPSNLKHQEGSVDPRSRTPDLEHCTIAPSLVRVSTGSGPREAKVNDKCKYFKERIV